MSPEMSIAVLLRSVLGSAAGRRGDTMDGGRSGLADLLDAGSDARVAVVDRVLGEVAVPFSGSLGGLVRCGGEVAGGAGLPAVADVAGEGGAPGGHVVRFLPGQRLRLLSAARTTPAWLSWGCGPRLRSEAMRPSSAMCWVSVLSALSAMSFGSFRVSG